MQLIFTQGGKESRRLCLLSLTTKCLTEDETVEGKTYAKPVGLKRRAKEAHQVNFSQGLYEADVCYFFAKTPHLFRHGRRKPVVGSHKATWQGKTTEGRPCRLRTHQNTLSGTLLPIQNRAISD